MSDTFRLVTRSDLDGLVSAVLLQELGMIDDIKFVHPKDIQDGTVELSKRDITTNLPYSPKVHLAIDHHLSEMTRLGGDIPKSYVCDPHAPSAARVVYNHFGGKKAFPNVPDSMMDGVDKADSAKFDRNDVMEPAGWVLLSFLTDPRTGLGRFREFRISNYNLMMELTKLCRTHTIEQILEHPDVRERVDVYNEHAAKAREQLERCSTMHGKVVVFDPRNEPQMWPANRFMIYALFPQATVSVHVMWGLKQQNTVLAVGKSIFDRSSKCNIGDLMLTHGGGGHTAAGTCQIDNASYETALKDIIQKINAAG